MAGGTAWLWASPDALDAVDVLFVDEAAQMSLANVLAVSHAARSVVLIGDPQQLEQPMQGSHPEGTDVSALHHLLNGKQTIGETKDCSLPRRGGFTLISANTLRSSSIPDAFIRGRDWRFSAFVRQAAFPVPASDTCLCLPREIKAARPKRRIVFAPSSRKFSPLALPGSIRDNVERPITLADILIIAPYNAQVFEIEDRLPGARIGTVDKFQGQEAPISIYSMTTSSYADAPRGMEFLYSLNRLNVATSRAKCLSILVASPSVFEAKCRTPRQMQLANAFCRYLEMATPL